MAEEVVAQARLGTESLAGDLARMRARLADMRSEVARPAEVRVDTRTAESRLKLVRDQLAELRARAAAGAGIRVDIPPAVPAGGGGGPAGGFGGIGAAAQGARNFSEGLERAAKTIIAIDAGLTAVEGAMAGMDIAAGLFAGDMEQAERGAKGMEQALRGIPIIGSRVVDLGQQIHELLTGQRAEIQRINDEAAAVNATVDAHRASLAATQQAYAGIRGIIIDIRRQLALAQTPEGPQRDLLAQAFGLAENRERVERQLSDQIKGVRDKFKDEIDKAQAELNEARQRESANERPSQAETIVGGAAGGVAGRARARALEEAKADREISARRLEELERRQQAELDALEQQRRLALAGLAELEQAERQALEQRQRDEAAAEQAKREEQARTDAERERRRQESHERELDRIEEEEQRREDAERERRERYQRQLAQDLDRAIRDMIERGEAAAEAERRAVEERERGTRVGQLSDVAAQLQASVLARADNLRPFMDRGLRDPRAQQLADISRANRGLPNERTGESAAEFRQRRQEEKKRTAALDRIAQNTEPGNAGDVLQVELVG